MSPAVYPSTTDVSALSLALYRALETSYPRMPAEEQRLLRHTMLDQTRPWEALATDMPTLRSAISPEVLGLVHDMPCTLADGFFAPAFIWGLTQDWVPNHISMIESILNKWSIEHVHNEDLNDANLPAHIQLMRSLHLLMDRIPFGVDPLVYAKVLKHTKEIHRPFGADRYSDDTAAVWLQWLARTAMRAEDAIETEFGAPAPVVWSSIAASVLGFDSYHILPALRHAKTFTSILDSSLPAMWKLLTLRESHPDYWTLPQFVPRLKHLVSSRVGTRALEMPWSEIDNPKMQYKAIESNKRLAQTFFPDHYPALAIVLKEENWASRLGLVQALLASVFSAADSSVETASLDGLFDSVQQ